MIYWLTGVIGSGKTTVGAALASRLPQTHFVDGDNLVSDAENLPFHDKIKARKDRLIEICKEWTKGNKSAVISYPVTKETADIIKRVVESQNGKILFIGLVQIHDTGTRDYSQWEQTRRKEMEDMDVSGKSFADIILKHPTEYLYDTVENLLQRIKEDH